MSWYKKNSIGFKNYDTYDYDEDYDIYGRSRKKKVYNGITNWQNSFFGGLGKIANTLPYISQKNFGGEAILMKRTTYMHGGIYDYNMTNVLKHLLLLSKTIDLSKEENYYIHKESSFRGQEDEYYALKKEYIEELIGSTKSHELFDLFDGLKDDLSNYLIGFPVEKENNKNSQSGNNNSENNSENNSGSGPGNGKNNENSESEESKLPGKINIENFLFDPGKQRFSSENEKVNFIMPKKLDFEFNFKKNPLLDFVEDSFRNMLDIDFRPKEGIINNLRFGKIEERKIAEGYSGYPFIFNVKTEDVLYEPFSLCILGDESGSMYGYSIIEQAFFINTVYNTFLPILGPNKIFVYGHSGNPCDVVAYSDPLNLNFYKNYISVNGAAMECGKRFCLNYRDFFRYPDAIANKYKNVDYTLPTHPNYYFFGNNVDGFAIETVWERVRKFTDEKILFISFSDGAPCKMGDLSPKEKMKIAIEKARRDNFVTLGVGIAGHSVADYYKHNVTLNSAIGKGQKELLKEFKRLANAINAVVKQELATAET